MSCSFFSFEKQLKRLHLLLEELVWHNYNFFKSFQQILYIFFLRIVYYNERVTEKMAWNYQTRYYIDCVEKRQM